MTVTLVSFEVKTAFLKVCEIPLCCCGWDGEIRGGRKYTWLVVGGGVENTRGEGVWDDWCDEYADQWKSNFPETDREMEQQQFWENNFVLLNRIAKAVLQKPGYQFYATLVDDSGEIVCEVSRLITAQITQAHFQPTYFAANSAS